MNKICAIINSRNHIPFGKALEYFGWCDVFYSKNSKRATGLPASNSDIKDLGIDFTKYSNLILHHETAADRYAAKLAREQNLKILIIGNQHGYYKSILQIKGRPTNLYDYWNVWGKYWIERSKKVLGVVPKNWVNLGSIKHDYYFKTKKWTAKDTNGKALVIYEPNTNESYQDKMPEIHNEAILAIIDSLEKLKLPYDIKAHPLWPKLKGNDGKKMWAPPKRMRDFDVEKIIEYSIILGSRSTLLLDAISMGIPTVGFASKSDWEDDEYGPAKVDLFPYFSNRKEIKNAIKKYFNGAISYDKHKISFFLGDLGRVSSGYLDFCKSEAWKKKHRTFIARYIDKWKATRYS